MDLTLRIEIFPSDLDAVVEFYTGVLRFELVTDQRTTHGYVALRRGSVQIGAAVRPAEETSVADRRPPTGVELVLEVDDVEHERAQVLRAGWPLEEDLTARPWGLTDVRLLDPAGHYLRLTDRVPRRSFVLHDHRRPRPHFDLRLEEGGVLRSWALPRGLPTTPAQNRLAVAVPDHDLDHLAYEDEHKSVADTGWWEEHDRNERRFVFSLHGRSGVRRYALIRTDQDWLLHLTKEQPGRPLPG